MTIRTSEWTPRSVLLDATSLSLITEYPRSSAEVSVVFFRDLSRLTPSFFRYGLKPVTLVSKEV